MKKDSMPKMIIYMTPFPYKIHSNSSLREAQEMMNKHNICHLPVIDDAEDSDFFNIISERDIDRALSFGHTRVEEDLLVSDICPIRAYIVDANDPLDRVLEVMAEKRIDAVLVSRHGDLAGIFTATDACRLFAQRLQTDFPRPRTGPGGDAA